MALSQRNENTIRLLSRVNVEKTLAGLKRFTKESRWLSKNNRYSVYTVDKIISEMRGGSIQNPRHLSHYIAASCLLHCTDGLSYLGKAILSLLRGDPHRSLHLAYYAELRAAMSLLATAGIGVFHLKHFVINAPQMVSPLQGGGTTHVFTWDCLVAWAQQNVSGDVFANVVRPYGRSLDDWFAPLGGGRVVAPQAQDWFRQWGMDIEVFSRDRGARNESSYHPDGLPSAWSIEVPSTIQFVKEIWAALEPSSASFDTIDRHILRLSIESIFKSQSGKTAVDDRDGFERFVHSIVNHQNMSPAGEQNWLQFITRTIDENDPSIFVLSKQPPRAFGDSVLAIISRATLLLRMASGSNSQLFQDAGYDADSISFWWQGLGQDRGLWDGTHDADALTDLWSDVAVCLESVERFQTTYNIKKQTFSKFATENGNALIVLGSFELAAIWSMTSA